MCFKSELHMKKVRGKRGITLLAPLKFRSEKYDKLITVPTNTYSNFGSVPAVVPPIIVPRVGKLADGFVVHDWLYETYGEHGEYTRLEADQVLDEALKCLGVWWWRRAIVFAGVRGNIFAEMRWRKEK